VWLWPPYGPTHGLTGGQPFCKPEVILSRQKEEMNDYSNDIANYWSTIMHAWQEFRDRHPIIECDLKERKVYAYPATDYIKSLSERTRAKTLRQYKKVTATGGMMLFIKDPQRQILQSHVYDAKEITPHDECESQA
jgi:hypothetical protein